MKRTALALAAAASLAAALPSSAQAHCHGCGVAAGVVGGLAAGAIIGSAIANSGAGLCRTAVPRRRRGSITTTTMRPVCHVERRRVWVEGYGWRHRRIEVCD